MFDRIVRYSLREPAVRPGGGGAAAGTAAWSASRTPVDVFPDLNKPLVTVLTEAGGLARGGRAAGHATRSRPRLNGTPGVTRVRSTSGVGLSISTWSSTGAPTSTCDRQLVAERLALAREQLPAGVSPAMARCPRSWGRSCWSRCRSDRAEGGGQRRWRRASSRTGSCSARACSPSRASRRSVPIGGEVKQLRVDPIPRAWRSSASR